MSEPEPAQSHRERLAALLAEVGRPEGVGAALAVAPGDLRLEVRGVGPIKLPVSQAQAKQLCLVARPARHGQGERTLVDRRVRDTWEIPKSRVKIDKRRWNRTLLPVLDRLGVELGLPAGQALRAELHSMLVYAPGQFFLEHQDSEKDDAMVGTLVVGLPSTFKGGALEVRHGGRTATYRGSKTALSFVAFYSDCRHQVKPVASGFRVVLTYNLLLRDAAPRPAPDPGSELVGTLASCLEAHFASPEGRDRLVYLLDHEYTPRSFGLSRLKGTDARRVPLLLAAAERAGCEAVLALADVHELWSAYEEGEPAPWGRPYGRGGWDELDEEEEYFDADGSGEYDLEELIESQVVLQHWIDSRGGRPAEVNLALYDDEVCASTPSGDLEPYSAEYEGYMGNWGNTLDRWYHRAAVAVWPRDRAFAVRAEADPSWALDEVGSRARNGDLTGAREAAATVDAFWSRVAARVGSKGFFAKALRTARLLDEPALAAMLLRPFRLEALTAARAKELSALVDCYGERWAGELVTAWSAKWRFHHAHGPTPEEWMASLPRLCSALKGAGDGGASAARAVLRESWSWARQSVEQGLEMASPSRRERALSELGRPIGAILECAPAVGETELREEAVGLLCGEEQLVGCAIAVLREIPGSQWNAAGVDAVAAHCAATLTARLAQAPRAGEDWSIELPQGCDCELCSDLGAFLRDATRTDFEWPLAKARRAHVHSRIDAAELPVAHQTRRVGRPYTLVLTKTDALFERERQRRRSDGKDLAWLLRNSPDRASRRTRSGR